MTGALTFDLVVAALVLLLGVKGAFNGFQRELFGFVGLIGGVYAASRAAAPLAGLMERSGVDFVNHATVKLLAFLLVLAAVWGGVSFLGTLLHSFTARSGLTTGSRLGGFLLAALKYFLVFSLIVAALFRTPLVRENVGGGIVHSRLYPLLEQTGAWLIDIHPKIESSRPNGKGKR